MGTVTPFAGEIPEVHAQNRGKALEAYSVVKKLFQRTKELRENRMAEIDVEQNLINKHEEKRNLLQGEVKDLDAFLDEARKSIQVICDALGVPNNMEMDQPELPGMNEGQDEPEKPKRGRPRK